METVQFVYKGFISEITYRENDEALFIGDNYYPIADELQDRIQGKLVSVRYWISDFEKTKEELVDNKIRTIIGDVFADYGDRYSDVTGYLWTDQDLKIGGHDLLSELRTNVGKFIYMEIDVHN